MTEQKALDLTRQLTKAELGEIEEEKQFIRLYEMRTSLEPRFTLDDQARELGVSVSTVKRMAKSDRFKEVATKLAPATRSVMVDAAQEHIADVLLPKALKVAEEILDAPNVQPGTKINVIQMVFARAFAGREEARDEAHRQDAMEFLKQQGIQAGSINVVINNFTGMAPPEYVEGLRAILPPETVEGEVVSSPG